MFRPLSLLNNQCGRETLFTVYPGTSLCFNLITGRVEQPIECGTLEWQTL